MIVTGESLFISSKTGLKKDNTPWYSLKFLDEDAEEFFTMFVDDKLFNHFQGVGKKTGVILTMETLPGSKFCTLRNVEILN